ncbi:MAG TPA: glycosyltransferase family 2 protein [Rubricoccaceae bacterium]
MTALVALLVLAMHAGVLGILAGNVWHAWRGRFVGRDAAGRAAVVRVSVLVPARNEEANLARLLPSVLGQRGVEFELIVVDDASEDGTARVLADHVTERLVAVASAGPPAGRVGKTHPLHTAAARATGDVFVFLDADAVLRDDHALARLVGRWQHHGASGTALTGLPHYLDRGPAALLTSLVPFAVLAALPIPLVPLTASPAVSALNGQIWILGAADYRRLAPHAAHEAEILEDVMIGRFLKRSGVRLHFDDLQRDVAVRMYGSFGEAWHGFRKNAYLLGGGTPGRFATFFALYTLAWVLPSVLWLSGPLGLATLATLVAVKGVVDRSQGFPPWLSLAAPVSLALGAVIQLDSALAHARGRVAWKGRAVG